MDDPEMKKYDMAKSYCVRCGVVLYLFSHDRDGINDNFIENHQRSNICKIGYRDKLISDLLNGE